MQHFYKHFERLECSLTPISIRVFSRSSTVYCIHHSHFFRFTSATCAYESEERTFELWIFCPYSPYFSTVGLTL